mgnify:CR=1 FL=1
MSRNFDRLRQENYIATLDDRIVFEEASHTYYVDGQKVPKSVTKFVKEVTRDDFDGTLIIERNLASWRAKPASKYFDLIDGLDDQSATAAILEEWNGAGRIGTSLHKRMEGLLNGEEDVSDNKTDTEFETLKAFLSESLFGQELEPLRTELSVFYEQDDGTVPVAGQIDALFVDKSNEMVLIDFKRTAHDLSSGAVPFKGKTCSWPLEGHYANDFTKYSLQQSFYAVMVEQRMGIPIPANKRFLLQVPPGGTQCNLIPCACFDEEVKQILDHVTEKRRRVLE